MLCVSCAIVCAHPCIIEHFEPLSQHASNEFWAPTSEWLFLNKPCLIDCVPPPCSPSGGRCVTASLKLQISICHSGSSAASGLTGVLVKSLQNRAIKKRGAGPDGVVAMADGGVFCHRRRRVRISRRSSAVNVQKVLVTHINNRWHWVSAARPRPLELTDVRSEGSQSAALQSPKAWPPFLPPLPHPPTTTNHRRLSACGNTAARALSTRPAIHFHGRIAFKCSLGEEWVCRVA